MDEDEDEPWTISKPCSVCGGPHDPIPDDCPVMLSKLLYERGMLFPHPRPPMPPRDNPPQFDSEDDGN